MMRACLAILLVCATTVGAWAQSGSLTFATVERPPFSFSQDGAVQGFSVDLMRAVGREIGWDVTFEVKQSFAEMLGAVETFEVDGAVANISITGAREAVFDFSQPIFRSGLQIMLPKEGSGPSIWSAIFSRDLGLAILGAFALLLGMGMLMWVLERRHQPYFDRNAREVMFPAFWWALNLVVNGGFEQNVPRSAIGRLFAVLMVVSSLFIVSFFVANITAVMTVRALNESIETINDLEGRSVGTTTGSTASAYLTDRDISHVTFDGFDTVLSAFEAGDLDAVFFDGPLLRYYVATRGTDTARLVDRVFRPENYGIALPTGSPLREAINVALLRLDESGEYNTIVDKWFKGAR